LALQNINIFIPIKDILVFQALACKYRLGLGTA
jgi:hypothetical protein